MILFSVGFLGRFAAWCDAAIARQAGGAEVVAAETEEEVAAALIRSTTQHLVVAARHPVPSLRALLAESQSAVTVSLDDPRQGVYEMVSRGFDLRSSVRRVARGSAAAAICAALPGATVVTPDDEPGFPVTDIRPWWDSLDPAERALIDGALASPTQITWDRSLLWRPGEISRHAGAAVELDDSVGPLIIGPDIDLPPGKWAASVTLAVSRETAGIAFDVVVHGPGPLASAHITPDARGLCSATLVFSIPPEGGIVALSIANTAPAPEGKLALGNIVLVASPADGAEIPTELTTVLGL